MIVKFSRGDVERFRSAYPCSGLKVKAGFVEFATNGDLVDHNIKGTNGQAEIDFVAALQAGEYGRIYRPREA